MISRVLQEEGMPQDLIYLAQAESAFQRWRCPEPGREASGNLWPGAQ